MQKTKSNRVLQQQQHASLNPVPVGRSQLTMGSNGIQKVTQSQELLPKLF